MRLVRARPKLPEHLLDWDFCCDEFRQTVFSLGEFTVDLAETRTGVSYCRFCGRTTENVIIARRVGTPWFTPLDLLDLDETGIPNGNYVEAVAP